MHEKTQHEIEEKERKKDRALVLKLALERIAAAPSRYAPARYMLIAFR